MNTTVALIGWGEKIASKMPILIVYRDGRKLFRLMPLPMVNRVADARFKNNFKWYRHFNMPVDGDHILSIGMYRNPNI
jgi:hypothetical protein